MSNSKLDVLSQYCKDLLLAEVAALLHDIGKFTNLHIEAHTNGPRKWSNNHAYKAVVDDPSSVIRLSKAASGLRKPDALNNVISGRGHKAADFLPADAKRYLENTRITIAGENYSLAELIMLGTPGFATSPQRTQLLDGKPGWVAAVLGVCHNEAHHDKQEPSSGEGAQTYPEVFISTAFGFEHQKVITGHSPDSLDNRLGNLFPPSRDAVLKELSFGLGDTRRPINEVTMADWAWTVAALFKSALAEAILSGQQRHIGEWQSWKDKIIHHHLRWRILRVNFDVLGLYAKAVKIADLLAYKQKIDEAYAAIKHMIEEEYPLGNEVYRDTTGIYFTFPDLDLWDELGNLLREKIEEIEPELAPRIGVEQGKGNTANEQLMTLLSEGRKRALEKLAYPFDDENMSDYWGEKWREAPASSEVCPVCRLRPLKEGTEVCEHCLERRRSRIEWWQQHPSETIWLDEIADHNDRIALIVGKFGLDDWLFGDLVQTMLVRAVENKPDECRPKNPSPARLRRVWETCERFWTETVVKGVFVGYEYGENTKNPVLRCTRLVVAPDNKKDWRENIPYDGIVGGRPISLLWDGKRKQFLTIINLQLAAGDETDLDALIQDWQGQEVEVSDPDNPHRHLRFKVQRVAPAPGEVGSYRPTLTVLTSPDQFLAFIPASDALEVAEKIRQEYIRQFGKVQNRLPLFLGLVFFQRKTPLVAVIDTARRMLEQVSLPEESWIVESNDPSSDGLKRQVFLLRNGQQVIFEIPVKMGDDVTEDIWYPYFFVADGTEINSRKLRFQHNGRWLVHVNDLRKGDYVHVIPSRFAYLFLESTAQRFRFDPEKHVLLLDDLTRLMTMWESVCRSPEMSQTKLQAIQALFRSKQQLWRLDETKTPDYAEREKTFRQLVEITLNRGKVQGVSVNEVMNGLFGHCLELYLHILKCKVKEEEHEQEPATV